MDGDSVHARSELKTRHEQIFVPSRRRNFIRTAKVKQPLYVAKELSQTYCRTDLLQNISNGARFLLQR